MDGERATKRQRIETTPSTPPHLGRPRTLGQRTPSSVLRHSQQIQSPAKPTDVYDDIEGAHRGHTPLKRQQRPADRSLLDPLRNQQDATTSPLKSSPRKFVPRGFFKQFSTPKKVNGNEGARRYDAESEDELVQASPSRQAGVADVTMSGTTPSPPQKTPRTFEDEIRALEEAARKQAVDEDDTLWNVQQRTKRKNAGVHSRDIGQDHVTSSARKGVPSTRTASGRKKTEQVDVRLSQTPDRNHALVQATHNLKAPQHVNGAAAISSIAKRKTAVSAHPPLPRSPGTPSKTPKSAQSALTQRLSKPPKLTKTLLVPEHKPTLTSPNLSSALNASTLPDEPDDSSVSVKVSQHSMPRLPTDKVVAPKAALAVLRNVLLGKMTGARPVPLTGHADELAKVTALISQTIEAGESNSMLIIGARGSGKTAMVNQILREQSVKHGNDFLVVRLNGFVHTDDKVALRDIWRQLGREMELEQTEHAIKNHADTLTTLLAMLSHSSDQATDSNLVSKSVIFIMDEFDRFAHHPRQTLLYNLFDIAQSRKAPIAVIGLTTRVDVSESLEKRVKSRFSHRYVHLSLPRSFNSFVDISRAALQITPAELSSSEQHELSSCIVRATPSNAVRGADDTLTLWNAWVDDFLASGVVAEHLKWIYHRNKSIPEFITSQLIAVATIPSDVQLTSSQLTQHFCSNIERSSLQPPDSLLDLLIALSTLQAALLICAARLHAIYDAEATTFALVYEEYKTLASKAKLQASSAGALAHGAGARVCTKPVAKYAWDELIEYGLIVDDGRGNGRADVGLEEIGLSSADLGQWRKWCKEI